MSSTTRRERLEAKLAKREEWAQKASVRSDQRYNTAHAITKDIPFGQPILVGHHSEKRHRGAIERSDANMRKACEEADLAKHHASKAGGLGDMLDRAIFSDDPDAIDALTAKAEGLEAECDLMKRANAAYRKAKGAPGWAAGLGLDDPQAMEAKAAALFRLCPYEKQPYPAYKLSNTRAEIGRARKRIKDIEARTARTAKAEQSGGVVIEGDGDWVRITFAEKPDRSVLNELKAAGFYWGSGSWCGARAKIPASVTSQSPI